MTKKWIKLSLEDANDFIGKRVGFADDSGVVTHIGILQSIDADYAYPFSLMTTSGLARFKHCAVRVWV